MSLPRALVVRSGANPFVSFAVSSRLEILEKSSHSIEPLEPDSALLEAPVEFTVFTSQVAVERLFADERRASLFRAATADGIVVYSIGKNGIDEQGDMRRHGVLGAGDDQAFRLWNEEFRGRLPMAPPLAKKKK